TGITAPLTTVSMKNWIGLEKIFFRPFHTALIPSTASSNAFLRPSIAGLATLSITHLITSMTLENTSRRTLRTGTMTFSTAHLMSLARLWKIAEATLTPGTITLSTTHLRTEARTGHTVFQVSNSQFRAITSTSDRIIAIVLKWLTIGGITGITILITSISAANRTIAIYVNGSLNRDTATTKLNKSSTKTGNKGASATITPSSHSPRTSTRGPSDSISPPTASSRMVNIGSIATSKAPTISPM